MDVCSTSEKHRMKFATHLDGWMTGQLQLTTTDEKVKHCCTMDVLMDEYNTQERAKGRTAHHISMAASREKCECDSAQASTKKDDGWVDEFMDGCKVLSTFNHHRQLQASCRSEENKRWQPRKWLVSGRGHAETNLKARSSLRCCHIRWRQTPDCWNQLLILKPLPLLLRLIGVVVVAVQETK